MVFSAMDNRRTIEYYNNNADLFMNNTIDVEFSGIQEWFLSQLQPGSLILDFGCGTGRDSYYFLKKGYRVEACDGSEMMVRIATQVTGISVKHMLFSELNEIERYDGIFACASILHVPSSELPVILKKMKRAVKRKGILYLSFKYGTFEGFRNGRYFTDLTERGLEKLIRDVDGLEIINTKITADVRTERQNEKWLNVLLRRSDL